MRQKLTEKLLQNITAFSNNAITSKVFRIVLCLKKQWKSDKFFFLLIYSFIYFRKILFPKSASIIQIFKNFCYVYQNILMKKQIFKAHKIYLSGSILIKKSLKHLYHPACKGNLEGQEVVNASK